VEAEQYKKQGGNEFESMVEEMLGQESKKEVEMKSQCNCCTK